MIYKGSIKVLLDDADIKAKEKIYKYSEITYNKLFKAEEHQKAIKALKGMYLIIRNQNQDESEHTFCRALFDSNKYCFCSRLNNNNISINAIIFDKSVKPLFDKYHWDNPKTKEGALFDYGKIKFE